MIMIQAQERLGGGRGITKPRKSRAMPKRCAGAGILLAEILRKNFLR